MTPLLQAASSWPAALSTALATALIASAWQGTLLVLLAAAALRWLPAISAEARSLIWLAALLLLAALNTAPLLPAHALAASHATGLLHADPRWSLALTALWLSVSLLRLIELLHSVVALRRITRRATPLPLDAASAALLHRKHQSPVQLCASADVARPSVVGFFSPTILLPLHLAASLTPAELEPVLRHEMEHLRRHDDWINLLQKLALCLFPLSPAVFWVERRLCAERELACDDGVLQATGARKAYATSLARLAEGSLLHRGFALALGAWDRRSALEQRVRRILQPAAQPLSTRSTSAAVLTLLVAACTGSLLLAKAPQLVSFQPTTLATTTPLPAAPRASSPSSPAAHIALVSVHRRRHSAPPLPRPIAQPLPTPVAHRTPHIQLTDWQPLDDTLPQPTPATQPQLVFTYAVRVPGGWLILQL